MNKEIPPFLPVMGGTTYTNPLTVHGASGGDLVLPDPYVLKHNGVYYAYATGESGVPVLFSKDGVNWESRGYAYRREGFKGYWAPAVVYENGVFYMYVSSMPQEEDDVHTQRLLVASSADPLGPFEYIKTFYNTFSLDAHVVKDEQGDYFLFYSNNEFSGVDSERPGTVILVDRLLDMVTPEGKPRLVVAPTIDEEIYEENRFGDGRDWHTIEGAFYLRRGEKHYVIYSGNAYVRPNYFLGYSTASAERGKKLTDVNWNKYPSDDVFVPLLCKNEGVEGVGHNSVVRGPNNVDDWVYYHGRNAEEELDFSREQRTMRTDPLLWCGEEMWVPGPSYFAQEAPSRPAFQDLFDEKDAAGLSANWQVLAGTWALNDNVVIQQERSGIMSAVIGQSFAHSVLEVNLRWHYDHRGGLYGIYPCYVDERNYVICLFDVGRRWLQAYAVRNGVKQAMIRAELPQHFRFDAYHLLRVEKTGGKYVFLLDGTKVLEGLFPFSEGRVGLVTLYTSASFASVEITEYLALSDGQGDGFASHLRLAEGGGSAEVRESELLCRSPKQRSAWLIDWPSSSAGDYRFTFDMKMSAKSDYAGCYAVYEQEGHAVEVRVERQTGKALVLGVDAGQARVLSEQRLPEGFNWSRMHTVSVDFRSGKLFVRLDRQALFNGEIPLTSGMPGFISSGNTDYRMISVTGIK